MKKSPLELIRSDLYRCTGGSGWNLLFKNLLINRGFKYAFWFRLSSHDNFIISLPARFFHRYLSVKYNIQIPRETIIGAGLYLGHATSIVISPSAVIGRNCNLSQFTSIGSNNNSAAIIGDDVYIGPNTCLVENVVIGNGVTIGAGSVVIKSIPAGKTVAGNPARIVSSKEPGRFVNNKIEY